jgi:hypothetical protein
MVNLRREFGALQKSSRPDLPVQSAFTDSILRETSDRRFAVRNRKAKKSHLPEKRGPITVLRIPGGIIRLLPRCHVVPISLVDYFLDTTGFEPTACFDIWLATFHIIEMLYDTPFPNTPQTNHIEERPKCRHQLSL